MMRGFEPKSMKTDATLPGFEPTTSLKTRCNFFFSRTCAVVFHRSTEYRSRVGRRAASFVIENPESRETNASRAGFALASFGIFVSTFHSTGTF